MENITRNTHSSSVSFVFASHETSDSEDVGINRVDIKQGESDGLPGIGA